MLALNVTVLVKFAKHTIIEHTSVSNVRKSGNTNMSGVRGGVDGTADAKRESESSRLL